MTSRSPSSYGTFPTPEDLAVDATIVAGTNAPQQSVPQIASNSNPAMTTKRRSDGDGKASVDVEPADDVQALNEAIEHEHALSFREAVKLYPKAVGWSAFVSIGVIMLAFDPQIVGNMFAIPQFKKDFGDAHPNGEVQAN